MKTLTILGILALFMLLVIPGAVSAATLPLSTTQSGTVSGDLYLGAFQNPAWNNQVTSPGVKEYTQSYTIPAFTSIQWARLETVVYAAGTDTRHGQTTVMFDGNGDGTYETTLGEEDQQTASSPDGEVYTVNGHSDRCYSDYRIWYDVTSLISAQNPAAYIKTENLDSSTFDGRVKEITLIVAYNDDDADQVMYWVNTGHDYQASGAAGVTTSFDTTAVPSGFTSATLRNVGLASKDALYTFNTLTPTGADPVAPYNYFETHAWDVTSGITAGSASSFGYTNNGGSFKTTIAALTVRSPAPVQQPDLIVTALNPNVGAGAFMFANEPNAIAVTVKNNGTGAAAASTLGVDVGGTVYTAAVGALAAGATSTVNVTDTVSRTGDASVTVTATADSAGVITESDETNNVLTPAALTVYNNGYKGKRWTGGSDITTQATFNGKYNIVYSTGNAVYRSAKWTTASVAWSSTDLPIPIGATVVSARLYQPYSYNKMGIDPAFMVSFNGNALSPIATYKDSKGFGSYNYPYGLYVYDTTSLYNSAGNTLVLTPEGTAGITNDYALFGAYLLVVYSDPESTNKQILINDEFDMVQSQAQYSVTTNEATAYATFSGIDTTNIGNAHATAILASAGDVNKSKFLFNSNEYPGFWLDYLSGPQIGFSTYDVTAALASNDNIAMLQSLDPGTKGDNMYAMNVILVVNEPTITVVTPKGGENWTQGSTETIKWNYTGNPGATVKIEALRGETVIATIPSVSIGSGGSGFFNLTVPSGTPLGTNYRIRVTSTSNPTITDTSDGQFTISSPIAVVSPDGGEVWVLGSSQSVQWSYSGNPGSTVKIEALRGETVIATIPSVSIGSGGSGFFNLTVPSNTPIGDNYRFRISSTSNPYYTDTSNAPFTISADSSSSINLVSPNGAEIWTQGSIQFINWTYAGDPGSTVKIEFLKGSNVLKTLTSIPTTSGSVSVDVPYNAPHGDDYRVKITSTSSPAYTDTSADSFTVQSAITVISPDGGVDWKQGSTCIIEWAYSGNPGSTVKIEAIKGTKVLARIPSFPIGDAGKGSYSLNIPPNTPIGNDYLIRVTSTSYPGCTNTSDQFAITAP